MKKLLLVDGNSMLFRAYYATVYGARMSSSKGIPTNAVFGFANMLQKAIDTVQPDSILVAFDAGKHTFRHDLYQDYKGTRKPAPDDLVPQFGMARDYLDGFHIRWVEMPEIEGDDLIGSMSKKSADYMTTILTSDHDMLQLLDDTTRVMLMKKGITDMEEMTPASLQESMGLTPSQIIDMKGLMGDSSDNIPGIPGIGEKTAIKLLSEYGTVENVLAHDQEIKGALGKKIQEGHESAVLSKKLATIRRDVPLDFDASDCVFQPDYAGLIRFFVSVDMKSLVRRYEPLLNQTAAQPAAAEAAPAPVPAASNSASIEASTCPPALLQGTCAVCLDETGGSFWEAEVNGIALTNGSETVYVSRENLLKDQPLLDYLNGDKIKIGYDVKRCMHLLERAGFTIRFQEDAMILASLADSMLTSTEKIFEAFDLHTDLTIEDVYGKPGRPKLPVHEEQVKLCTCTAENILKLYQLTSEHIHEDQMDSLYHDIEMPLTSILYEMERTGVICDVSILAGIAAGMQKQIEQEQAEIYRLAGHEFNINSPKQLADVLYSELGLPTGKKRSTSADVLDQFVGVHPIIEPLQTYRKLQKLNSTYAEGLQKYIAQDGRIHTIYNQCATQTGRLSSSEPNLQNITVRDEQGRQIRKAFLPDPGCVLISSDYHQIELRMLAHMADEEHLIAAFRSGIDIHTKTAMDVFDVSENEVTPIMRRRAKVVNFGIVYGISDFGLAQQLGVSRREAGDFIARYYEKYPRIRTYMDSLVQFCEDHGYVETLCGRRRDIPQIHDKNRMVREFGKRAAMNAPIQGSAADLIKIAMIHIDAAMKAAGVKSRMILQVHDELIFNVPKEEVETMKQLIDDGMTHAMDLKVPLTAEMSIGSDWYEAK